MTEQGRKRIQWQKIFHIFYSDFVTGWGKIERKFN